MSFHHDYEAWLRETREENCSFCQKAKDPHRHEILKDFPHSLLCAHPRVCLKGTCCLIVKNHFVELYDMDEIWLCGFMKEAQTAAQVLLKVTGAVKINYEIHGNTAPHLHMHLFPRYLDDPFAGAPIDYRKIEPPVYGEGEFERYVGEMRAALKPL